MKTFNKYLIAIALFFVAVPSFGQEDSEKKSEFTISGEVRPRTEVNHGNGNMGLMTKEIAPGYKQKGNYATSQRTRLNFGYSASKVKFGLSLQDIRVWGSQKQLTKNEDFATSVHQAWAQVYFTPEISLKAGRMELVYDDHRIFGNVGWAQQARSHDLAMFKYEGAIKADLGLGYHGAPYTGADAYNNMQFLHVQGKVADLKWSFLALNKGGAEYEIYKDLATPIDENTTYNQTIGTHLSYKMGAISFALNGYYQTGKNTADWVNKDSVTTVPTTLKGKAHDGQKIGAYEFSLEAMYKINDGFSAGAGIEMLSGNSYKYDSGTGSYVQDGNDQNAFNPYFGTNHKFNGWMDYFYVGNHGGDVGLTDIYAKFIYKNGPFTFKLFPHFFLPGGKSGYTYVPKTGTPEQRDLKALGTEIDFAVVYKINKIANIQVGASYMSATESMHALKEGSFTYNEGAEYGQNYWVWTMLVLKPKFLNYSK